MTRAARDLSALEERLGYRFKDIALLEEALTHKSAVASGRRRISNQRLEFLGDRVLGLAVAQMLYQSFEQNHEGELSQRHTALVRNETCVEVALMLDLGSHIEVEDEKQHGQLRENHTVLGDACEAVIAAIFLDGGYAPAQAMITRYWQPLMSASAEAPRHAKALLLEWAHGRGLPDPIYREVSRSGPPHKPTFRISVEIGNIVPLEGVGASKREAEHAAAAMMLARERVLPHD